MARPTNPVPKMIPHRDGRALVSFKDPATGRRRTVTLGPWGSAEAAANYKRLLADLLLGHAPPAPAKAKAAADLTLAELADRYDAHAAAYYVGVDGRPTSELANIRLAVDVADGVAGADPAREFGPRMLARVRDAMVARGWSRSYVNAQVGRLRRMFRWGAEQELVGGGVWQALAAVRGLARGRTKARETEPVGPVPDADVEATLPHLAGHWAAMVRFQRPTGCRPQDVLGLTGAELDRSADVWVYRPGAHKGAWRGKVREVFVGPRAQAVLAPWLLKAGDGRVWPYTISGYAGAIEKAARKAGVAHWSPNRLRHSCATEVRTRYGLEAAQVYLGHDRADVTQTYAERNRQLGLDVARQVG
jgi:integrase